MRPSPRLWMQLNVLDLEIVMKIARLYNCTANCEAGLFFRSRKRKGFNLIEVIVATVILSVTTAGLLNLFVSSKRWLMHNQASIAGGEIGKYFLDPLQLAVRADNSTLTARDGWNSTYNKFYIPPGDAEQRYDMVSQTINGIIFHSNYTVYPVTATEIRKVKVELGWQGQER